MNYVFDIDGTICFDGKTISQEISEQLITLSKNNTVIFASARPIRDMVHLIPQDIQSNVWIGGNGTFTKINDNILYKQLPDVEVQTILQHINDLGYNYMIDSDWDYSFKGDKQCPLYNNINKTSAKNLSIEDLPSICKIVIFDAKDETHDLLDTLNVEVTEHSRENIIDISTEGCSKDQALKQLGIHEYIAFGNDANDVGMFTNAIESYCVETSPYSMFATHTVERDEVANTLKQINDQKA